MPTVLTEDRGLIRTLTLNRPERRNALNVEMREELRSAIAAAQSDGVRVLVLAGAGESFCAGLDLSVLQQMNTLTAEEHGLQAEYLSNMFRELWECPLPTIAVVQGAAVAGGTGLATLCDFTLAAPEAKFGYTEARIGFVPALVSAYLSLQIGAKLAGGLLLSAKLFDAAEAYRLGLVSEIVSRDQLTERAYALASDLLANSPEGLRDTKNLLRAQQAPWLDQALSLAMKANADSRQTADFSEGVAAFLEKRKPNWTL